MWASGWSFKLPGKHTVFCYLENINNNSVGTWCLCDYKITRAFKIVKWFLHEYFSITPPLSLSSAYGTEVWYDKSKVTHASFWTAALPVAHACLELFTDWGERSKSSPVLHLIQHLRSHTQCDKLVLSNFIVVAESKNAEWSQAVNQTLVRNVAVWTWKRFAKLGSYSLYQQGLFLNYLFFSFK